MSRVGKQPIEMPAGVDFKVLDGFLVVKGPKGELKEKSHSAVSVSKNGTTLVCSVEKDDRETRSLHGLYRALVFNMVKGVSEGFTRVLDINGVGYRAQVAGKTVKLSLGFSHPINFPLPETVSAKTDGKGVQIVLSSANKALLGQVAAKIRSFRPPEPYRGKGVKYAEETIVRKEGKSAGK